MRRLACNELHGRVLSIREHALHATLAVAVGRAVVRADVPMGPVRHARIAEDDAVVLAFAPTDALLAFSTRPIDVSVASQVPGKVVAVEPDADVDAIVWVEVAPGARVAVLVENDVPAVGDDVLVLITACDVMPVR